MVLLFIGGVELLNVVVCKYRVKCTRHIVETRYTEESILSPPWIIKSFMERIVFLFSCSPSRFHTWTKSWRGTYTGPSTDECQVTFRQGTGSDCYPVLHGWWRSFWDLQWTVSRRSLPEHCPFLCPFTLVKGSDGVVPNYHRRYWLEIVSEFYTIRDPILEIRLKE